LPANVSHLRAIFYALAGFTLWVLTDTGIKLAAAAGLPPYEVIGFLGAVGMLFMLIKTLPRGAGAVRALWPRRAGAQSGMSLLALGCNLCNVVALKHLPLTIFYIVVFTAPMIIALLATWFLRERLNTAKIAAILAGFAGVVVAIDPGGAPAGNTMGYVAGFGSVLFFASNMVGSRALAQSENPESLTFFNGLFQAGLCLAPAVYFFVPMTAKTFFILLAAGLLNVIANLLIYKALKHTAAANVAPFHYTQLLSGAVIGWLIWHEMPTAHLVVGAIVIVAAGLAIAAEAQRAEKLAMIKPP